MSDDFSSYEDELNVLLDKLSKTILTFGTLSREQAENAILETTNKMNDCDVLLKRMESYIKDYEGENEGKIEKHELGNKLTKYKTEYFNLVNKFKNIQDIYINRKTESALIDELESSGTGTKKSILVENEQKSQIANNTYKQKNQEKIVFSVENEKDIKVNFNNYVNQNTKNADISVNNINNTEQNLTAGFQQNRNIFNQGIEKKISPNNISLRLNQSDNEETFNNLNKTHNTKKLKICFGITILVIILIILSIIIISCAKSGKGNN